MSANEQALFSNLWGDQASRRKPSLGIRQFLSDNGTLKNTKRKNSAIWSNQKISNNSPKNSLSTTLSSPNRVVRAVKLIRIVTLIRNVKLIRNVTLIRILTFTTRKAVKFKTKMMMGRFRVRQLSTGWPDSKHLRLWRNILSSLQFLLAYW